MIRVEYLIGQFGPRAARRFALAMALEEGELPGDDWTKQGESCFRTGSFRIGTRPSEEAGRAYGAKTFTAWRSFQRSGTSQTLSVQVIPYASAGDAESTAPKLRATWELNGRKIIALLSERQLDPNEIPEAAEYSFLYEQSILGKEGKIISRYIGGTVDNVVFLVAGSEPDGGWRWSDVTSVAAKQALKIREVLVL
jgi:hypothetical protein